MAKYRRIICPDCKGSGYEGIAKTADVEELKVENLTLKSCQTCDGNGVVKQSVGGYQPDDSAMRGE